MFYSVQQIRSTPTLVYIRVVYAVVILIKLSISTSTTELGELLKSEDIKVSIYLDKLLVHLKAVATLEDEDTHLLGAKFLQILTKVKVWFQRQQEKLHRPANEETRPATGFEPFRPTESKREDLSQHTDKLNFFNDFSEAPTMNTTAWPNQSQSSNVYSDSNYPMQPSWNDMAFDFPMDLDPNLLTQLIQADQTLNHQDSETSNGETLNQMDLNNLPDFGNWPMQ